MRNSFKELSSFQQPVTYSGNEEAILHILSNGFGALVIFALLGVYYRLQARTHEKGQIDNLYGFAAAKKAVSLLLLVFFIGMGVRALFLSIQGISHTDFFHDFYTLLIISDILLVLIAQCFKPSFFSIFRNSGFALSTLIIRLALVAPVYFDVLLGLAAILLAISLTLVSSTLFQTAAQE